MFGNKVNDAVKLIKASGKVCKTAMHFDVLKELVTNLTRRMR